MLVVACWSCASPDASHHHTIDDAALLGKDDRFADRR